jgi:aryl-alcohol dehydrogenase-like predicted oxidoreductase
MSFAHGRLSGGFIVSLRSGFVTTVIIGAKWMAQLRDNIAGERVVSSMPDIGSALNQMPLRLSND